MDGCSKNDDDSNDESHPLKRRPETELKSEFFSKSPTPVVDQILEK